MSNFPVGKSDYDRFGEAFAKSRKNMEWPEIDAFIGILSGLRAEISDGPIRILEAGSGSGRFFSMLRDRMPEFEYVGFDSSSVLLNSAKKDFPDGKFVLADMRSAADFDEITENAPYHAVVAIASFHHLLTEGDRSKALSEFRKVLLPNGLFLMTGWNLLSTSNSSKYDRYREAWSNVFRIPFSGIPRRYFAFEENWLRKEISGNGFEIVSLEKNERNLVAVARRVK